MTKIRFEYEINKCNECPAYMTKETLTPDSWEHASNCYCGVNNKKIADYIEWDSELPEIPKWCPYMIKGGD